MIGRDAYGYSLGYFNNDYFSISGNGDFIASTAMINDLNFNVDGSVTSDAPGLFNGNISQMVASITQPGTGTILPQITGYRYDQLNRINQMKAYRTMSTQNFIDNEWASGNNYDFSYETSNISYDGNGNIMSRMRNGDAGVSTARDNFT